MIDNEFYKSLGDRWFTSKGDAVALLRLEKRLTTPWVVERISAVRELKATTLLDVGCGGGHLSLALSELGVDCFGLDVDDRVLSAGRKRDPRGRVTWVKGSAGQLPFAAENFDVVCLLDVLEHLFQPRQAIREATRVVKRDGLILTHTFNRTWLAWLIAAKGLDWFIKDSQPHIHDWRLFIRPSEMRMWLEELGFNTQFTGLRPKIFSAAFLKLLLTRRVPEEFEFELCHDLHIGYLGQARRRLV